MQVVLLIDPNALWYWHQLLAQALVNEGQHNVFVRFVAPGAGLPAPIKALLRAERRFFRRVGHGASVAALDGPSAMVAFPDVPAGARIDVVIDLAGGGQGAVPGALRTIRPHYDGQTGVLAVVTALLAGRLPFIQVHDSARPAIPFAALPANDKPDQLSRGLESVFSRVGELILGVVEQRIGAFPEAIPRTYLERGRGVTAAGFFRSAVGGKVRGRIAQAQGERLRWRIGWRRVAQSGVRDDFRLSLDAYRWLPNDKDRWYADPFVRWHDGVHHVLCEDFVEREGKGVISAFTIAADGTLSKPVVVLERPHHLSYPFLFEHEGHVFMMPELSANRTVDIYRAARFPDRWVHHATILADVAVDDATLVLHGDRWWLFAGSRHWQSTCWDALSLYHGPSPFGPFQPHPFNPVVVDARSARPAGAMEVRNGVLWRPAQDCTDGYGSGMTLCRVDALSGDAYRQSAVVSVKAARGSLVKGVHTLNYAAGLEVIDAFSPPT